MCLLLLMLVMVLVAVLMAAQLLQLVRASSTTDGVCVCVWGGGGHVLASCFMGHGFKAHH